jgi:hypothetical protein
MRACLPLAILGCLLLAGCIPDVVSISRDGTIALTLRDNGEFEAVEGDQNLYLTNATADFLTKIDGMENCVCPQISPSGRLIVAPSEEGLLLYDRETKKRRVIYRGPKGAGDFSVSFPVWSPDEQKIAFFAGDFEESVPDCALIVYRLDRRELEVLDRRASPRATWLPDSNRLLYISLPPGVSEDSEEPQFGDLKIINLKTGKRNTLARRQLFAYSKIALFPEGKAVLFPRVEWDGMEMRPGGITARVLLRKELLPRLRTRAEKEKRREAEGAEVPKLEEPEAQPSAAETEAPETEEQPEERSFDLAGGRPVFPYTCAVSPDGQKIAYARYLWVPRPAEREEPEEEETKGQPEETGEEEPSEVDQQDRGPDGVEFCVSRADGTGTIVVGRSLEEGLPLVLWISNTRLLCASWEGITVVDADGKNKLDLVEAIGKKFADQFEKEEEKEGSGSEAGEKE